MQHSRHTFTPSVVALLTAMVGLSACSDAETVTDAGTDSGVDAGSDSGVDSGVSEWRVFVTNTVQNANFGGLDGADQLCATQAADAGLGGDFKAWLSTRSLSASDRLAHADGPYVLVDGILLADDWDDLVDGFIAAPINLDASGAVRTGDTWTGTLATGASYANDDCAAFASGSDGFALCGSTATIGAGWTQSATPDCSTELRLYCIEQ